MSEPAATPGARLKAERTRRGLSAQKAADEMHLDRWVVEALEADDYKRIGPTVYAKGHLKKYAALLGLPTAEIVAGYDSRPQGPAETISPGPSMMLTSRGDSPAMSGLSPTQIVSGVVMLLLVGGVLWWKPWHQRGKVPPIIAPVAAQLDSTALSSSAASAATVRDTPVESPPVQSQPTQTEPVPAAVPPDTAAVAGAGRARLRLSFSADSWVDVHDASGRRTYSGNGLANSVKTIAGTAPMRVYLGFGSGVQLEINDHVVAIGPQFFAGDVARFEAGADGVLRADPTHGAQSRNTRPPG
jgi:cytoskeleton protein RodZ